MEMISKIHLPVEQYGYAEIEYSFTDGNEDDFKKKMVEDYQLLKGMFEELNWNYEHISGVNWRSKKVRGETVREFFDSKTQEWRGE